MKISNAALLVLVLLYSHISFGQECQKGPDPFTNEPVLSFEWKVGGGRTLFYESRGGKITLEIKFGEIGAIEHTIPQGSEVLFKLDNGDIIKTSTMLEVRSAVSTSTIDADNSMTFSMYYLKMEITAEQLKQFSKFRVTNMRIPDLHGGFVTYGTKELRNKFERFLFEGAVCLMDGK